MTDTTSDVSIRPLDELDISAIVRIDEKILGAYRPEVWERRIGYYLRRDPETSVVAELEGRVVGFMLGEVRSGEFGLEEPTGWVEVLGVDPDCRGRNVGRQMGETILQRFRERGAHSVRTLVDEENEELRGFFGSIGFEPSSFRAFTRPI
jgi:ribosomal protein S18 acetylase RimI-like enzyme